MSRRSSKGKRKTSPPASLSSDEDDPQDVPEERHLSKKRRVNSPARVKQAALSRVASTSMSGASSKKGLAGFAALINSTSLAAARKETNRGLRSGSSSTKQSRNGGSSSKAGNTDDIFAVGTIVFLVVGVTSNTAAEERSASFHPVYRLQDDVDISAIALTGMKQSGLCVMKGSDTFDTINSSWLVCMKPPRKSLIVYSDDRLPTGSDIITACQLAKSKVSVSNRILYLVTRNPVPSAILKTWRPSISALHQASDIDDHSSNETHSRISSPSYSPVSLPRTQQSLRHRRLRDRSEEVEQDVISISSVSDTESSVPGVTVPAPANKATTPPCVEAIQDSFFSSINLDEGENPWIPYDSNTAA